MRAALMITGAVMWAATAVTIVGALVWTAAQWARTWLRARREARTHLSDASLRRFLEQASREGHQ